MDNGRVILGLCGKRRDLAGNLATEMKSKHLDLLVSWCHGHGWIGWAVEVLTE